MKCQFPAVRPPQGTIDSISFTTKIINIWIYSLSGFADIPAMLLFLRLALRARRFNLPMTGTVIVAGSIYMLLNNYRLKDEIG
ncbi:MAG: hypothetical protein CMM74_00685 [Rhodospirillaceae bacterium]|nr:hypothetical protein [Rhodospirillaceae bacterium]